ncbi:hypothetical protein SERLA73DRAFT_81779, partial [Serpula lacrymans var. lacrymans S7.3]
AQGKEFGGLGHLGALAPGKNEVNHNKVAPAPGCCTSNNGMTGMAPPICK